MAKNIHLTLVFHCLGLERLINQALLNLGESFKNAKKVACINPGIERTILSLFFQHHFDELPIAILGGMAEGFTIDQGYWLRADPIHIKLAHNAAYYMGYDDLNLKSDEINSLLEAINSFLSQDNIELYAPHADQWYLCCQQAPNTMTIPPSEVIGKDIYEYLPTGAAKQRWRHLFTELQMLLYRHDVNVIRRSHGQLEMNGLWFWGCGQLPEKVEQQWKKVWTDLPWMQGLVEYLDVASGGGCEDIASCLAQIDTPGHYLIVKHLDPGQLQQTLKQWCDGALEWVNKKRGHQLKIYPGDGHCYTVMKRWYSRLML